MHACTFYETIKRYRCLVSESVKGRNIIMWNNIHVKLYFDFEESPQMTIVVRSFVRYVTTYGTRSGWTSREGQLNAIIIFTWVVDVRRRVHNTFMLNIWTAYSHNQPNDFANVVNLRVRLPLKFRSEKNVFSLDYWTIFIYLFVYSLYKQYIFLDSELGQEPSHIRNEAECTNYLMLSLPLLVWLLESWSELL